MGVVRQLSLGVLAVLLVMAAGATAGTRALAADGPIVFSARPKGVGARGWQLLVANPDGSGLRGLTRVDGDVTPTWSPGGGQVIFERCCLPSQIWRVKADGTSARRISPGLLDFRAPARAPRGNRIAFENWSNRDKGSVDIYVMRADGRYRRRLTRARGIEEDPGWSPDARRIVFSSERTGNYELYVMNADGSGQRRLTSTPADAEYGAAWSPDGTRIAFWRRGHGSDAIVVLTLADRSERTISPLPADDNFPA